MPTALTTRTQLQDAKTESQSQRHEYEVHHIYHLVWLGSLSFQFNRDSQSRGNWMATAGW